MSSPCSTPSAPAADTRAEDLQRAFALFNQVSAELTHAYEALQAKVVSLTDELTVANGQLRQQYREKEALSERLSSLLDALPAGVVLLDAAANVAALNPAAVGMFTAEAIGRHWGDVVLNHLIPTVTVGEWMLGERRLAIAENALPSGDGKILLLHDVSLAHQMKSELERSQRLAAMGEMAASLAHQLRTPLAAALLYTANLGKSEMSEAAREKFSEKAAAQLRRLERLIQDVLLFAKGESIGRDVIVLGDLLVEAAQTMNPLMLAHSVQLRMDDRCGDAKVVGSRKALLGALINLLENALQATPAGGEITLAGTLTADQALISVRDSGSGVSAEMKSRIFEPFFTTKGQGTGLGLAIALGVARAHAGDIEVASPEGGGALFSIRLPVAAGGAEGKHGG